MTSTSVSAMAITAATDRRPEVLERTMSSPIPAPMDTVWTIRRAAHHMGEFGVRQQDTWIRELKIQASRERVRADGRRRLAGPHGTVPRGAGRAPILERSTVRRGGDGD